MIKILANQHQLILGLSFPLFIIQGETPAAEVEHMTFGAFVEPENALGAEDGLGQLIVQKMLKLANGKGAVALKGEGGKPIHF